MMGPTARFKVNFGRRPGLPQRNREPRPSPRCTEKAASTQPSRAARMLALAHLVERLVVTDQLRDYADAAAVLGITRARMTQIMNLLLLCPEIQERTLSGEGEVSERRLRSTCREPDWEVQRAEQNATNRLGSEGHSLDKQKRPSPKNK